MLRIFERRILRRIYGPVMENGIWRSKYNRELYKLYNGPDMVKEIKVGQLRWMGHLFRIQEQNPYRTFTVCKPESTRRIGRSAIRWLDSVGDLKPLGFRNLRRKSQDRDQWRAVVRGQGSSWTVALAKEEQGKVSRILVIRSFELLLHCVHEYGFRTFTQSLQ
jgi:hypothetical protein